MKTNVKLTLIVLLAVIFAVHIGTVGAQEAAVRVWPSSEVEQAAAGQEITVTVNIAGAEQIYGGTFQLTYDPAAFEVVLVENQAIVPGDFFGAGPSFPLKNTASAGTIDYALTLTQPAQPVSGDGVLGTIRLRALQDAPVVINTVKADLVSPEFIEVEGKQVAQRINQVAAEVAPMTVTAAPVAAAPVVEQPAVVQPTAVTANTAVASVSVANANSAPVSSAPVVLPEQTPAPSPSNPALLIAGLLFMGGLLLLTVSVGMYSKMRVRFSLAPGRRELMI